jgi:type II secretory pathway pseudopilin PulG
MKARHGYVLIMLMFVVTVMAIGLMVAVPVWETQIRREKEAELIFRGNQYVEAVRIYQLKNPGSLPQKLDILVEKKCLRRLFKDPMTPEGEWNLILQMPGVNVGRGPQGFRTPGPGVRTSPGQPMRAATTQKIMIAPANALSSIQNPQILGVVSSSDQKSIKIYNDQESYDKWLFYYGLDPENPPEIVYYGRQAKLP